MAVTKIDESNFNRAQSELDIIQGLNDEIDAVRNSLPGILVGSATWNYADGATASQESVDITVTGAAMGDFVLCSMGVDIQDLIMCAAVTAANTVTVTLANETGATVTLASTTVRVLVIGKAAIALVAKVITNS